MAFSPLKLEKLERFFYIKIWYRSKVPALVNRISQAFQKEEIPYRTVGIPIGAIDASPFCQHGIPGVTIIGMTTRGLDPTYHTWRDIPENVEEEALERVKRGLTRLIEDWDR